MSRYKAVWIFALFDLPVKTPKDRRHYTLFRKKLLQLGFDMLQYSVYARYFPSEKSSEKYKAYIRKELPPDGEVRLLMVTDRQFGKMQVFYGKKRHDPEKPPEQLRLL